MDTGVTMDAGVTIREPKMKSYWVYILCSTKNGALYIGVTNNIVRRVWEHKQKLIEGYTKRKNTVKLVYLEECNDINAALWREKCLKNWNRAWKIRLIEEQNPNWIDFYEAEFGKSGVH